ncbi:MAG: sugar phosphate isomerase/epimerase, partial [candidate division KSB1 bacterium]|nr:sugar phosphate isomerase/epimerase [candidate division KSB1 bacterium]
MKIAICNELFQNWRLEEIIPFCAEIGYDGLEMAPFTLTQQPNRVPREQRRNWRKLAEQHHLQLIGLHWLLVGPPGLSISSPDPDVRKFTQSYLLDLIDLCADLGGDRLVFGSPKQRVIAPEQSYEEVWEYARQIFQGILPRAADKGVTICLEPLSPLET